MDHLQVTTPGQGRGPTAFVLFGAPSEDTASVLSLPFHPQLCIVFPFDDTLLTPLPFDKDLTLPRFMCLSHTHTHTHIYIYMYIYIHAHSHIRTHTRTNTHTHTHKQRHTKHTRPGRHIHAKTHAHQTRQTHPHTHTPTHPPECVFLNILRININSLRCLLECAFESINEGQSMSCVQSEHVSRHGTGSLVRRVWGAESRCGIQNEDFADPSVAR